MNAERANLIVKRRRSLTTKPTRLQMSASSSLAIAEITMRELVMCHGYPEGRVDKNSVGDRQTGVRVRVYHAGMLTCEAVSLCEGCTA